jgi:hypothetical protein
MPQLIALPHTQLCRYISVNNNLFYLISETLLGIVKHIHYTTLKVLEPIIITYHSLIHQRFYSPLLGPGLFFSFVSFFTQTIGLLDEWPARRKAATYTGQHKHRINAHTMPWVVYEPMIPAFKWEKTVHALDGTAIMIDIKYHTPKYFLSLMSIFVPLTIPASVKQQGNKALGRLLTFPVHSVLFT